MIARLTKRISEQAQPLASAIQNARNIVRQNAIESGRVLLQCFSSLVLPIGPVEFVQLISLLLPATQTVEYS